MSAEWNLGPLEVAAVTSMVVFGITCLQCYLYYTEHSENDPLPLKCLVGVLMMLETISAALISNITYLCTVESFAGLHVYTNVMWSLLAEGIVSTLLSTITQCFFAMRIYYLNGRHCFLPAVIVIMALILLVSGITITIISLILPTRYTSAQDALFIDSGSTRMFLLAFCDVAISMSTIYYLRKSRTSFARTNRAINKLIKYTLSTGLLITLFGIATAVVILVWQPSLTYTPFYSNMTRLYACSLISILNSREAVQKELGHSTTGDPDTIDDIFTTVGFDQAAFSTRTTAANGHSDQTSLG